MSKRTWALSLLLLGCGPSRLGDVGCYCKPDGSCNGPLLECVPSGTIAGAPIDAPSCQPKRKR